MRDNAAENAFIHSFVPDVLEKLNLQEEKINGNDEGEYFKSVGLPYVIPELRWTERCLEYPENELLCEKDLLGIVHCHTTASDGINTLEEDALCDLAGGLSLLASQITADLRATLVDWMKTV